MNKVQARRILNGCGAQPLPGATDEMVRQQALAEREQTARDQGYDGDDWQPTLEDLEYVEAQIIVSMRAHAYGRQHVADKTR